MTVGWVTAVGNVRLQDFVELVAAAFTTGRAAPGGTATAAHMDFTLDGLSFTADITGYDLVYAGDGAPIDGFISGATIRDDAGNALLYLSGFDINIDDVGTALALEQLGYNWSVEHYIGTWLLTYFSNVAAGEWIVLGSPVGNDEWTFNPTGPISLHLAGGNDTVYLGSNSDFVQAGAGDDTIYGGAGHDSIFSETGIDVIVPGAGNDAITADNEDTVVYFGRSTDYSFSTTYDTFLFLDVIDLRPDSPDGHDNIHVIFEGLYLEFADTTLVLTVVNGVPTLTPGVGVTISGTPGDDLISRTQGPAGQPLATRFADTIYGGNGNDTIDGWRGGDSMYGGAGDDTYYVDHQADRAIEDTGGAAGGLNDQVITSVDYQIGDFVENLTLVGPAILGMGNELGNRITGSDLPNLLYGRGGNDIIDGKVGDDVIYGEAGNDLILGGNGYDFLEGGEGDDTIDAGTGHDVVFGGTGSDTFLFKVADLTSADSLDGGNEDAAIDWLTFTTAGTITAAAISGVIGMERLQLADGTNSIALVDGFVDDNPGVIIKGGNGNDTVDASLLTATHGITIASGGGDDTLKGGLGSDTFQFTILQLTAADKVQGGGGSAIDWLQLTKAGTLAASALNGISGIERLQLTSGINSITLTDVAAAANPDLIIKGGSGNDTVDASGVGATHRLSVVSGTGNDTLLGGLGADQFAFAVAELTAADTVNGGSGAALDALNFTTNGTITAAALGGVSNIERLYLAGGSSNTLTMDDAFAGRNTALIVKGNSGNDTIDFSAFSASHGMTVNSGTGNDTLKGGLGSDFFQFNVADLTSADIVQGGGGASLDWVQFTNAGIITASKLAGLSGIERLQLSTGTNAVTLNNAVMTANADLVVKGSGGNDVIDGTSVSAANHVSAFGGAGTDTLKGGAGADVLSGEAGNDLIQGGLGADTLTGGADADTFQWTVRDTTATDRVTDFAAGSDKLSFLAAAFDFGGSGFDSRLATASTATSITGADLVIYSGGPLNTLADAKAYLAAAAGGSAGEGVFLLGTNTSGHTVLFHALDASFANNDVAFVADLGLVSAASIQLSDFAFA